MRRVTETQIKETKYQNIKSKTLCKQFFLKKNVNLSKSRKGEGLEAGWR